MLLASRALSIGGTLTLAVILAGGGAREARAQIFDYAIQDAGAGGQLGTAVARIGDIDSDGCEDFIVGEPNGVEFGITGVARLESGRTGSEIDIVLEDSGGDLGAAVAGRIDVDADGFLDVLYGAPLDGRFAVEGGAIFAYSPHLKLLIEWRYGTLNKRHLGSSVRSLEGDVDGDGVDDYIVGSPGNDTALVISSWTNNVLFTNNGQSGAGFGTAVCRGGDLDGDGIVDYVVGSPDFVDSGGTTTGRVTAFSGKTGNPLWSVNGAADSNFGKSLAQPGDLDGDGQGDIVVGAPQHLDSGGNKTGCVTVLSGANQSVLYKVFGDGANDTFGHDVHGAGGDIDSDGTVDFIVGAPQLLGSDVGYARTVSGATGGTLFTFTEHTSDPNTKSNYGKSVCGGDFDGDGRTDVLIGGSNFNNGDGIAEVWTTAVARWNNYGFGWPGTHGVPGLTSQADPAVGKTLKLDLGNSAGAATTAMLMLGLSKASIPTGKGGTLLVSPLLFLPLSLPVGGLTLSGQVPNDPSLYGLDLYLQAIELDPGASKGLSFTTGLDLYFGYD
jgi:FG-GAP repeat protein